MNGRIKSHILEYEDKYKGRKLLLIKFALVLNKNYLFLCI